MTLLCLLLAAGGVALLRIFLPLGVALLNGTVLLGVLTAEETALSEPKSRPRRRRTWIRRWKVRARRLKISPAGWKRRLKERLRPL